MHRTQILLKEHQYRALRTQARREGRSLSSLIRQAVSDFLGIDGGDTASLEDLRGLGRDPGGPSSREHDSVLYGWKNRE